MNHRAIAGSLMLVAVCACGSAGDSVTFKAPAAYKADVSIGPFAQTWTGPNRSMIMLMAIPTKLDLTKRISKSPVNDATIESDRQVTICGSQPARAGTMRGNDHAQQIEFLATTVRGKTYMAMYVRPDGTPADPGAESAIRNVCAR